MTFILSEQLQSAGFSLQSYETIGSTNTEALREGQAGGRSHKWYVTTAQDNGRGRRGRTWSTERGNLAATLLIIHQLDLIVAATLSFVAGLSLVQAVDGLMPGCDIEFTLKWPNDVLADGAKLSGILLESSILPDGRKALAIGVGVNITNTPDNLPYAAACLKRLGYGFDAETLFSALAQRFHENLEVWDNGSGMDYIRDQWLARAARLGETIKVQSGNDLVEGVFTTIDREGQLVLTLPQNRRLVVSAGEVFFGEVTA